LHGTLLAFADRPLADAKRTRHLCFGSTFNEELFQERTVGRRKQFKAFAKPN
jgi:hypothetical protein